MNRLIFWFIKSKNRPREIPYGTKPVNDGSDCICLRACSQVPFRWLTKLGIRFIMVSFMSRLVICMTLPIWWYVACPSHSLSLTAVLLQFFCPSPSPFMMMTIIVWGHIVQFDLDGWQNLVGIWLWHYLWYWFRWDIISVTVREPERQDKYLDLFEPQVISFTKSNWTWLQIFTLSKDLKQYITVQYLYKYIVQ